MKNKGFVLLSFIALVCGCDSPELLKQKDYSFFIVRFADDAYKEMIITTNNEGNGIYTFPKRYRNEPYFGRERQLQNREKYTYDICELAIEEKLEGLHDNYFTYFPYTSIGGGENDVVRDGKWKDLCNVNPLDLSIKLTGANSIYSDIRYFNFVNLENLIQKKRDEMTIDDIIDAINTIIDSKLLDSYSTTVSSMWLSWQ